MHPLFSKGKRLPFVRFLQLLGKLTAASTVIPMGLLALRPIQMWLNGFTLDPKRHRARQVMVSQGCIHAVVSWRDHTFLGGLLWASSCPFGRPSQQMRPGPAGPAGMAGRLRGSGLPTTAHITSSCWSYRPSI